MIIILDIARGFAALWVFFYHVKALFSESSSLIVSIAEYGHLGVPIFFVISGYVITYSAESNIKSGRIATDFLKRRFLRIYPTFWASIIVVLLTPYIIELVSMLKSGTYTVPSLTIAELTVSEWFHFIALTKVFFAENSNLDTQFNTINSVYWTLAIEFQFYLMVTIALIFKKIFKLIIISITGISILNTYVPLGLNYGVFIHYWPTFAIGIVLAYIHKQNWRIEAYYRDYTYLTYFVLSAFIFGLMVMYLANEKEYSINVFAMLFALLLWVLSPAEKLLNKIKNGHNNVLYWILESFIALGAMSYSVYLLHGKIYLLPNMFVRQLFDQSNVTYGLLTVFLTLLIVWPFYYFVERGFLSVKYKNIHKKLLPDT